MSNDAFIDGQNLHSGIKQIGWTLDYHKFRNYLGDHYRDRHEYYFVGYIPTQEPMYARLRQAGFDLQFKPVVSSPKHPLKGNVDADLVLKVMVEMGNFDRAVLVS